MRIWGMRPGVTIARAIEVDVTDEEFSYLGMLAWERNENHRLALRLIGAIIQAPLLQAARAPRCWALGVVPQGKAMRAQGVQMREVASPACC